MRRWSNLVSVSQKNYFKSLRMWWVIDWPELHIQNFLVIKGLKREQICDGSICISLIVCRWMILLILFNIQWWEVIIWTGEFQVLHSVRLSFEFHYLFWQIFGNIVKITFLPTSMTSTGTVMGKCKKNIWSPLRRRRIFWSQPSTSSMDCTRKLKKKCKTFAHDWHVAFLGCWVTSLPIYGILKVLTHRIRAGPL